jgi:uncharacterized protein (TIGR01777 family)
MSARTLELTSQIPVAASELAAWCARPSSAARLIPPWLKLELVSERATSDGRELELTLPCGLVRSRVSLRESLTENAGAASLRAQAAWRVPVPALFGGRARRQLERYLRYRLERTRVDLERHARYAAGPRLRVLISGATGLIGRELSLFLESGGHQIVRLVRRASQRADEVAWDPLRGEIEQAKLTGIDAVVHLAGENVASHRWSPEQKRRIEDSRVLGTRTLCRALAQLATPPKVLISASAIGYYGETGSETRDESSAPGAGFLAEVCQKWEAESRVLGASGVRVVHARIGVVVARQSGAIEKMWLPFSLGLGGRIGSGRQYMSWISLDDLIGLLHFALFEERLLGPLNCVAPNPVTNAAFTARLARMLRRPTFLAVPELALRILYGEFTDEALRSQRVLPAQALRLGFPFRHSELEQAFAFELGIAPRSD